MEEEREVEKDREGSGGREENRERGGEKRERRE